MQKIVPFLWYSKEAEEAARFYAATFPDSRVISVTALQSESPSGPPGSVKIVEFTLFGQHFTAMSAGPMGCAIEDGRPAGAMRLAERPIRIVLADRAGDPGEDVRRP